MLTVERRKELQDLADTLVLDLTPEEQLQLINNAPEVAKSKGLREVEGGYIKYVFEAGLHTAPHALEAIPSEKKAGMRKKTAKDYRPTPEDLATILSVSNIDLSENDIFVYEPMVMDDQPDRQFDIVGQKTRKSAAKYLPDKSVLANHNRDIYDVLGKAFDARTQGNNLYCKFYVDAEKDGINRAIMLGILNKVSISFMSHPMNVICSSCRNKSIYSQDCRHWPGMADEKGQIVYALIGDCFDVHELSIVAVPAQPRAGIRRAPVAEDTMPNLPTSMNKSMKTFELTPKGVELTNSLEFEDAEIDIDKIPPVKLDGSNGEKSVSDQAKVSPETVKVDATDKGADTQAPAAKADDAPATVTVEALVPVLKELADALNKFEASVKATQDNTTAVLAKLVEASNKQHDAIQDALNLSKGNEAQEDLKKKAAADAAVASAVKVDNADITAPGGLGGALAKALLGAKVQ